VLFAVTFCLWLAAGLSRGDGRRSRKRKNQKKCDFVATMKLLRCPIKMLKNSRFAINVSVVGMLIDGAKSRRKFRVVLTG